MLTLFCKVHFILLVLYWIPKTDVPFMAQWASELYVSARFILPDYAIHPFDGIIAKVIKLDHLQYLMVVLFDDIKF